MIDMHNLSDRELLELAAEAGHIYGHTWSEPHLCLIKVGPSDKSFTGYYVTRWNPFTDVRQAMELASHLQLSVIFHDCLDDAPIVKVGDIYDHKTLYQHPNFPDPMLTMCRAIVIAAAQVGQQLREARYMVSRDNE